MTALIWLILSMLAGWRILHLFIGDIGQITVYRFSTPWPALLLKLCMAFWLGTLPLTWLTYALGALFSALLPPVIHPLLPANVLILIPLAVWLVLPGLKRALRNIRKPADSTKPDWTQRDSRLVTLAKSLKNPESLFFILSLAIFLLLGSLIMFQTFSQSGSRILAGYSVFSDFAPHTAVVSSFSQGSNWPTDYPHFAGDGIAYHFMFFFLCGNLNFLGLPLGLAINLPSLIGFLTFCVLLGMLAVRLTRRKATFLIAPLLLFLRSSMAFFTYLSDLVKVYIGSDQGLAAIWHTIRTQEVYIGNTPNDSWGLWGVNVYANQRHLLPGLSIALMIFMLFLPSLDKALNQKPCRLPTLFGLNAWSVQGQDTLKRIVLACLLGLLLPYFHGSALVALLLVLAVLAVFSKDKLGFLIFAAIALGGAVLQSKVFTGSTTAVINPSFEWGFIAPDRSLWGIIRYLLEMSGIVLPLSLMAFLLRGTVRKILIAGFLVPLVFAFTLSLTPDVTVNHKYIMICIALLNIYIADLLIRLWSRMPKQSQSQTETGTAIAKRISRQLLRRTIAVLLAVALTITGFMEINILGNISQKKVAIDTASPLVAWIKDYTDPKAVFVTAPYHYNTFYLSGRMTYLGHAYYAWSAGHDTRGRLETEQWLLTGCGGDLDQVAELVEIEEMDYLIIDDTLRSHPEFDVNETFFDEHFEIVSAFPSIGNMNIYELN